MTTDPTWATYTVLRDWEACTTPATWTPTAPWSYQVGVWARSSGNTADAPEASAGLVFAVVPDIRGTYTGSGSATNSGCTNPIDNGTFRFTGSITIPTQSGATFNGTGTVTATTAPRP